MDRGEEKRRLENSQEEDLSSSEDLPDLEELLLESELAGSHGDLRAVGPLDLVRFGEKEGEEGSDGAQSDEDDVGVCSEGRGKWERLS